MTAAGPDHPSGRTGRPVLLIGPPASGKSTLAPLVAARFGRPWLDLDAVADRYYREVGRDVDWLRRRSREIGYGAAHDEWAPALEHALMRAVAEHPAAVIAAGAGHSHLPGPGHARATAALAGCPVVLLLPCADPARSLALLRARCRQSKGGDWLHGERDLLAEWVASPQNAALATAVVFTDGESPAASVERVVAAIRCPARG